MLLQEIHDLFLIVQLYFHFLLDLVFNFRQLREEEFLVLFLGVLYSSTLLIDLSSAFHDFSLQLIYFSQNFTLDESQMFLVFFILRVYEHLLLHLVRLDHLQVILELDYLLQVVRL